MLPGVRVADLRVLLNFIYTGEVRVSEEALEDLLEVAEMLGVRGLKADKDDKDEHISVDNEVSEDSSKEDTDAKGIPLEEEVPEKPTETTSYSYETSPNLKEPEFPIAPKPMTPEPVILKMEPTVVNDQIDQIDPYQHQELETEEMQEEEEEEVEQEEPITAVKNEPMNPFPVEPSKPPYPASLQSQYNYMSPYMSPLVSMSNLAAMYQVGRLWEI